MRAIGALAKRFARPALALSVAIALAAPTDAGINDCCPGDTNGDQHVDQADLSQLLGYWGSSSDVADLDGSGTVGSTDLALLLLHWGPCAPPCPVVASGYVFRSNGMPASGAMVATEFGDATAAAQNGWYQLELAPPTLASPVHVTAIYEGLAGSETGQMTVNGLPAGLTIDLEPLIVLHSGQCEGDLLPTFGGLPGVDGEAHSLALFDAGLGPRVYVGGAFESANGQAIAKIAMWDGTAWYPAVASIDGDIYRLRVVDDGLGDGPALYACGSFSAIDGVASPSIARLTDAGWEAVGSRAAGLGTNGLALDVCAHPEGGIVVVGMFTAAGSTPAQNVARWNGRTWSSLGAGVGGAAYAVTSFHEPSRSGSAPVIVVGGSFSTAGSIPANCLARWDGANWSSIGNTLGGGVSAPTSNQSIADMVTYEESPGSTPRLFVAGVFSVIDGIPMKGVARWDGSAWSPVGEGTLSVGGTVSTLVVDDGDGTLPPRLLAGGSFTNLGGQSAKRVAVWDGSEWSPFAPDVPAGEVRSILPVGALDAPGPLANRIVVAGDFGQVGSLPAANIATYAPAARRADGDGEWSAFGTGLAEPAWVLAALDEPARAELFGVEPGAGTVLVRSSFQYRAADGTTSEVALAVWDGSQFIPIAGSPPAKVIVFGEESGEPVAYVGGTFTVQEGYPSASVLRWNGTTWSAVGEGLTGGVNDLALFDSGDGSGSQLYATGGFTASGGSTLQRIARWSGTAWLPLSTGLNGAGQALASWDHDGDGQPSLVVAGSFTTAGGGTAKRIARWDGAAFHPIGSGFNSAVADVALFDDGLGGGPTLYAAGSFSASGSSLVRGVSAFRNNAWTYLPGAPEPAFVLTTFEDPPAGARQLFVSGPQGKVLTWNGVEFDELRGSDGTPVDLAGALSLVASSGDGGLTLTIGLVNPASGAGDSYLARWGCANNQ